MRLLYEGGKQLETHWMDDDTEIRGCESEGKEVEREEWSERARERERERERSADISPAFTRSSSDSRRLLRSSFGLPSCRLLFSHPRRAMRAVALFLRQEQIPGIPHETLSFPT